MENDNMLQKYLQGTRSLILQVIVKPSGKALLGKIRVELAKLSSLCEPAIIEIKSNLYGRPKSKTLESYRVQSDHKT